MKSPNFNSLSKRESELIQCLGEGLTRKETAKKLNMSVHTYDGYRKNIRIKLQIKSQADWAKVLYQLTLINTH